MQIFILDTHTSPKSWTNLKIAQPKPSPTLTQAQPYPNPRPTLPCLALTLILGC